MMTINPTSFINTAGEIVTHVNFSGNPDQDRSIKVCPADKKAGLCLPIDTTEDEWIPIETIELTDRWLLCMENGNDNTSDSDKFILALLMGVNAQLNRTANTSKSA